jgi:quinol monooxygenase YgiN
MSASPQGDPIDDLRRKVLQMLDRLGQDAPIALAVVFHVDPSKEATFRHNAEVLKEATIRMPGVRLWDYHKQIPYQPGPPGKPAVQYLIYEDWDSTAHFRAGWNSDHLKHFQHTVGHLVVDSPHLSFYQGSGGATTMALVLKTGLTQCWDTAGNRIECKYSGQDGEFQAGAPSPTPRFRDEGNGTVTDRLTGLIWLKNANAFGEVPWDQALANANNLASGSQGLTDGSRAGDWRLPNIRELRSLIDYSRVNPILPAGHPFTDVQSAIYWTSTTLASAPLLAWMTTLGIGPSVFDIKPTPCRMWPVRGKQSRLSRTGQKQCWDVKGAVTGCQGTGQDGEIQAGIPWPDPRFHDNGDGTVTDNLTGLVWLKDADPFGFRTWWQALEDCNNLAHGRHGLGDGSKAGDWRLPNVCEIESLIDYGNFGPSLPQGHPFPTVKPTSYWTSTTVSSAPTQAMFVILGVGPSIFENKEVYLHVWPVRGARPVR